MRQLIFVSGVSAILMIPSLPHAQSSLPKEFPDSPRRISAPSATGFWNRLGPSSQEPPAHRMSAAAIYDPIGQRMLLFGGWGGPPYDDTWSLSLTDPSAGWRRIATTGPRPSPRLEHAAIYDPLRRRMIVFGGKDVNQYFGDIWQLDLNAEPTWSPLVTQGTPPSPRETRAIYDPVADRMVIASGYGHPNYIDETWTLDLSGTPTWHRLIMAQGLPVRAAHSAIYDPNGRRMLVFGGLGPGGYRNDLWALDLSGASAPSWQALSTSGATPTIRYGHGAIYDPDRHEMTVFGGYNGNYLSDHHVLSLADPPVWSSVTATPRPSPRDFFPLLFDPARRRVVLFGGNDGRTLADLWSFDPATFAWSTVSTSGPPSPAARLSAAGIFDPVGERMILFGGWGGRDFGDTWSLALNQTPPVWSRMAESGPAPTPRLEHTIVYDSRRNRLLLFGGKDQDEFFNDVWQLDLNGEPTWSPLATEGTPPSRRETRAIYDPVRDRLVLFGGFSPPNHMDETWILELGGTPTWRILSTRRSPAPRRGQTAVYDSRADRMLVFGGYDDQRFYNDVWELRLSGRQGWKQLSPQGAAPSPRYGIASAYLDDRNRMVVFGGWNGVFLNDGYILTLDRRPEWSPLESATDGPSPRDFHSLIYDAPRGRLVLHGGNDGNALDDYWEYELDAALAGSSQALEFGTPSEEREPAATAFALEGFVPNPAMGERRVTFSLPDSRPARVEVFDLAGRRVAATALAAPRPGRQVTSFGRAALSPGVYLVRLTQGERVSVVRGAVLR